MSQNEHMVLLQMQPTQPFIRRRSHSQFLKCTMHNFCSFALISSFRTIKAHDQIYVLVFLASLIIALKSVCIFFFSFSFGFILFLQFLSKTRVNICRSLYVQFHCNFFIPLTNCYGCIQFGSSD